MANDDKKDTETLAGQVERVSFHNPENGFCVLRVKARGRRDPVTLIGNTPLIQAGEFLHARGWWDNHRDHGLQFRATFLKVTPPTSLAGIERYLASVMIKGIGAQYAKRLLAAFGEAVFEVIEQTPERLQEVEGIGPLRGQRIAAGWAEQKAVREIMLFLQGHGVSPARAVRIYKTYGANAVPLVSENPSYEGFGVKGNRRRFNPLRSSLVRSKWRSLRRGQLGRGVGCEHLLQVISASTVDCWRAVPDVV